MLGGGVGNSPGEVGLPPPCGLFALRLAFFVGVSFSAWFGYLWRSVRGCSWCLASGFLRRFVCKVLWFRACATLRCC